MMSLVALGLRPSLNAAVKKKTGELNVSRTALYDKVNHTEPDVTRALVAGSADRLSPVMSELRQDVAPLLAGYRVRIIDGNHLPASEKRLGPLRGFRGAARPGLSLVVFDPDADLVVDLLPCEDAFTSERTLLDALLATMKPGELWIGDRNFCTRRAIEKIDGQGVAFLFREHGVTNPTPAGRRRKVGRVETGVVYEQLVDVPLESGRMLRIRRIELLLDVPTEDGDTIIRLLTNLPDEIDALTVARLYRQRWSIEGMFGRLEAALHSEVGTLGHPRAALLAFATAVVAYNLLSVIQAAIAAAHDLKATGIELSTYHIADDVKAYYAGMMVALPAGSCWSELAAQEPAALAQTLRDIATHLDPATLRKHPRGPKARKKVGYLPRATVQRQVATARVLRDGAIT